MRIFVISLPTQSERRAFIRAQFEQLNLAFSFFDAVDVRRRQTEYFRAFDLCRFELNTGRNPLPAEISCYASHLTLWRTCRVLDEPIIILENDAAPPATDDALAAHGLQDTGFVEPFSLQPQLRNSPASHLEGLNLAGSLTRQLQRDRPASVPCDRGG